MAAVIVLSILGFALYHFAHSVDASVSKTENGSIQINVNQDQLREKQIEIGDSLTFKFSSGYTMDDVPLINGEYLNPGNHIAIMKSDGQSIVYQIQNEVNLFDIANLKEDSNAHISLYKKQVYTNLNNAFQIPISGDTKNLRSLRGGNLKLLGFFRGIDPNVNIETSKIVKNYASNLNITKFINLDSKKDGIHSIDIKKPLCNYMVIDSLLELCNNNDKVYIYSSSEDFTAYYCAIIEALAGASYDEIVDDYMMTYQNLYGITKENNSDSYDAIKKYHIDTFLHQFTKTGQKYDLHLCDFAYSAESYLRYQGVKTHEIEMIKARLNN